MGQDSFYTQISNYQFILTPKKVFKDLTAQPGVGAVNAVIPYGIIQKWIMSKELQSEHNHRLLQGSSPRNFMRRNSHWHRCLLHAAQTFSLKTMFEGGSLKLRTV